jgi:hypothetical protein
VSERAAPRIFLLSPARLDGERARLLFRPQASFPLALGLRSIEGVPIGEVFKFLSGLYFRGKLAYAQRFARPPQKGPALGSGALVITQNRGLLPVETRVCLEHLESFAQTDVHHDELGFRKPLERDARQLADLLGETGEVVLLGSIATKKYVEPLLGVFGERLLFPGDFVGRGDMSRGGLLLRSVDSATELAYRPVVGATRKGTRPPKLAPRKPAR